jgi:hypothetical protein
MDFARLARPATTKDALRRDRFRSFHAASFVALADTHDPADPLRLNEDIRPGQSTPGPVPALV